MSDLVSEIQRDCRVAEAVSGLLVSVLGGVMTWAWAEMDAGTPTGQTGVLGSGIGVAAFLGMAVFFHCLGRSIAD